MTADDRFDHIKAELRWLAQALDEARDLDVFAEDNAALADGLDLAELAPLVEAARSKGHAKASAAVASGRFRDLVLDTTAWVEAGDWLTAGGRGARRRRETPVAAFASDALDHRRKVLIKRAHDLKGQDDESRHEARIAAKKLRYTAEAFAPLFDPAAAKLFIKTLKKLQDELGALNDAAVAAELVERLDLTGRARKAAEGLLAHRATNKPKTIRAAAKAMDRLQDAAVFWRS